jgi:hypothetical protein
MALSQYVAINFLTKFDKKGLERATKELKGFDKVVATGSFRLKSFAKAGGIAAVAGLAIFTKQSIQAALAQEKLDKQLQLTLKSIGQEFALPDVKNFVADLQRATNITEDQLVPALQKLISQTSSLESSQYLLSKALDISAGTGADLDTVLNAINKAAIGSYDSIAKLGIGFLIASSYIVTGEGDLKKFGIALESIASKVSDTFIGFGKVLSEEGVFKALITSFKELGEEGFKVRQKQYLQEKGYLGLSQFGIDALELQLKYGKQELTREQILAKIQKDILAREKATTKEKRAQEALDKKKAELSAMFDLEKINLQVSLSRKLTAEDELRVKILQKLTDGTTAAVNEAQRYADILKVIDDGKISDAEIATLAKTWGITTTEVVLYISKLMTANDELRKMIGLASQVNVGTPSVAATSTDKYDVIKKSLEKEFVSRGIEKGAASGLAASSVRLQAQADAYMAANPGMFDPLTGLRRVPLAEGGIVTRPTNALIGEAGAEAVIPLDRMGSFGTTVNVNVAGSVISEGELQSVIQDALYNLNRAGAVTQLTNLGR